MQVDLDILSPSLHLGRHSGDAAPLEAICNFSAISSGNPLQIDHMLENSSRAKNSPLHTHNYLM
jgi:hypothetical protein